MAKILLVQPSFAKKTANPYPPAMPLGLLYIGTVLKKNNHNVKILDRNLKPSDKYFKELLKNNYDFVGIGTFTGKMLYDAIDISKMTKENSDSIVVWGSFHPTIVPEQTLANPYVDYIIRGEAEETFLKMVELYDKKQDFSKLNGVNLNPDAIPPDINKLPFPDYDLIDVNAYDTFFISTSRGCPFKCTFCYNSYGSRSVKPYRDLSAEKTIKLIEYLTLKYKKSTITIPDDNFPSNRERLKKVANGIKKLDLKIYTFCRSNYADLETLNDLKKAGIWAVQIGIESGSQRILDFLNKATTVEMNANAIKNCRKIGIWSDTGFMLGIPTEKIQDMNATLKFIKQNKPDSGGMNIFHPFPKTKLWDYCIEKKLLKPPATTEEWAAHYSMNDVDMNVSEHPDKILLDYAKIGNQMLNKNKYLKKTLLYLRARRIPNIKRVLFAIKTKINQYKKF